MLGFFKRLFQRTSRDPRTISGEPLSPEAEAWLYTDINGKPVSDAVRAFIDGKATSLSAAEVDPETTAAFERYQQACTLKEQGDIEGAAQLIEASCVRPSIFNGHYRLLFQLWRQLNRSDIKEGQHVQVVERVSQMIRYDGEMIAAMLEHWGEVQGRKLPANHFDDSRNLKVSDAKALLAAATALERKDLVATAEKLIRRFKKKG